MPASAPPRVETTEGPPIRSDGLQLDEDRALQERLWTLERVVHGLLWLIVLLGLAGLAGAGGPLSRATAAGEAGTVDYPRILRWRTTDEIELRFADGARTHRLALAGGDLQRITVEGVQPEPSRTLAGNDMLVFDLETDGRPGATAALRLRPDQPGLIRLAIRLDDGAPAAVTMLVLP